ncbi:M20/M25/M40 family metallo-hydrolase [Marinicauda algicola]|uniref:M20/M25/M40 family metallo-hydrolase n=2 Tax=Marinicauda algicola TaxID=2029849 RepID=A0A4S2GZP3_9PROT|nr:M20/M25/M40 family metallo-hydrolase [Marinicauda algicola]TGY88478.1 M20/M25/M40 family metallo-hydrolase [Marinicauda algicola]
MRPGIMLAAAAALFVLQPGAGAQTDESGAVAGEARAWREGHEVAILRELRAFLALPNHASDAPAIRANAEHIVTLLQARGATARILEAGGSAPAVYGEIDTPGTDLTLMVYAHYDGQPVERALWRTDPFDPVLLSATHEAGGVPLDWDSLAAPVDPDARLYARSASDDKSPLIAVLAAIDALEAAGRPLAVDVKFFLEGEEEAGSPHLTQMLTAHRDLLDADIWLLADGPVDPRGDPRVMLGVRGVTRAELTVFGPARVLHSGHFGNVAPNPGARLAHLVASMRDENGRILIDGLDSPAQMSEAALAFLEDGAFDDAAMFAQAGIARPEWGEDARYGEAIAHPALNVLALSMGAQDGPATNAIQTEARATLGFRLTPGLPVETVREALAAHVRAQGYHLVEGEPTPQDRLVHDRLARLEFSEFGYAAAYTDPAHPLAARLIALADAASPEPLRVVPLLGGSLPLAPIQDVLGVPFVIVPMVNADNNQHAPNENLRIGNLWYGIELYAVILAGLGGEDGAPSR